MMISSRSAQASPAILTFMRMDCHRGQADNRLQWSRATYSSKRTPPPEFGPDSAPSDPKDSGLPRLWPVTISAEEWPKNMNHHK